MTAFDALAPDYDAEFTASQIALHLRARVHQRLRTRFASGSTVLELGCGTGEDAAFLAREGVQVIATDASIGMIDVARAKMAAHANVSFQALDLNALDKPSFEKVQGVFSNFGVINCVRDRRALAGWLAKQIPSGGTAAFGIMPPLCLWEMAWHAAHCDVRTAFRRLRGSLSFQINGGEPVMVDYPSVHTLTVEFAPYFRRVHVEPLGLLLPPTAVYASLEKRPGWMRRLTRWDDVLKAPFFANFADHYWIEFVRV
ncbi:MAG: methyltransferase domain-containing protein [Anaerolineae bacterium]